MAEVLAQFAETIEGTDGLPYRAQACGAPTGGGSWEGWIEFVPIDGGGAPVRSPRETTQPNRADATYWASGLTAIYLEGALNRALKPLVRKVVAPVHSVFDGPADATVGVPEVRAIEHDAVLDPFSVYGKGEALLRKELGALSAWHLVNIILAYRLSDESVVVLNRLPAAPLIDIIVSGVRTNRMASNPVRSRA